MLTAEGAVPPLEEGSFSLAGIRVGLHDGTQRGLHSTILAHIEHAGLNEEIWLDQLVARFEGAGGLEDAALMFHGRFL